MFGAGPHLRDSNLPLYKSDDELIDENFNLGCDHYWTETQNPFVNTFHTKMYQNMYYIIKRTNLFGV